MAILYLSRIPYTDPSDQNNRLSNFTSPDSIFPPTDAGQFQEISIVLVPDKPETTDDDDGGNGSAGANTWEWFAYLAATRELHAIVVPRRSATLHMMHVSPDHIFCAEKASDPYPHFNFVVFSRSHDAWYHVPPMRCEQRNLVGAAGAFLGHYLYIAGGYECSPSDAEPSNYLKLAERLDVTTWEWELLPPMRHARANATGMFHKGHFFVVGGSTHKHSAEIYSPTLDLWLFYETFIPTEADGFAVISAGGDTVMLLLTWSEQSEIKLWAMTGTMFVSFNNVWMLMGLFPGTTVERDRFVHGARMVQVGNEVWVLVGGEESSGDSQLQRQLETPIWGWPVFPAPSFRPGEGQEVECKGHIYGFHFEDDGRLIWRKIPIYSML